MESDNSFLIDIDGSSVNVSSEIDIDGSSVNVSSEILGSGSFPKVSYKRGVQKWVKHYRSLHRLTQKRYKINYKLKRRSIKYVKDLCRVPVTESLASGTENNFVKVLAATGRLKYVCAVVLC